MAGKKKGARAKTAGRRATTTAYAMLELVNRLRANSGRPPIRWDVETRGLDDPRGERNDRVTELRRRVAHVFPDQHCGRLTGAELDAFDALDELCRLARNVQDT